ncbi:transposase [Methanomassiliicoccaceae archaeon DOK]|nr:transposase [Methanomassiliicoccaceae archaeon DOK]
MEEMEGGSAEKGHVTVVYPAYPNGAQERELLRTLDVVRDLYNHLLAECITDVMEGGRFPTPREMNKGITVMRGQDEELRSVAVFTLRDAPLRVHAAMTRFAKLSARSGELRLPRFKSESRYRSLAIDPRGVRFDGRRMLHRPKGGKVVTARIVRRRSGRWYVHITFEADKRYRSEIDLSEPAQPEAFDLGLCDIITDSKGEKIEAPDFYAECENEIARLQRQIESMEDGPKRRKKQRRLSALHERIRRRRDGYLDGVANRMVSGHSAVILEDLRLRRMMERDDCPAPRRKLFTEAALGILVRKVEAKAERACIPLVKVDPAYTTRTCSCCGLVGEKMPLTRRVFSCPRCGLEMDRDHNAALNILGSGMGTLRGSAEPSG